MSALVYLPNSMSQSSLGLVKGFLTTLALATLASCGGGGGDVVSSGGGGGSTSLNFSSPWAGINLAAPNQLPAPSAGQGSGGIAAGANYASEVGAENLAAVPQGGRFNPNYASDTPKKSARLAWGTYWLDMSDKREATAIVLNWLDQPLPSNVWIGLANWDKNRWAWRKISSLNKVTPPNSLDPYIRDSDNMLACTILVIGADPAVLDTVATNQSGDTPPPEADGLLNENAHLGINLGTVDDWNPTTVFTDVFKTSKTWIPQDVVGGPWDNGHAINVDSNGWVTSLDPGQAVIAVMMTNMVGVYPEGNYTCLYDGDGTIEFTLNASVVSAEPGRLIVHVESDGTIGLRITSTNPADYVRNIRLIIPGYENTYETQVFHPDFLASIDEFNVLRFMDWGWTNTAQVEDWSDRTKLTSSTQTRSESAGVCLEHMIDLCNTQLADAWICIPYKATDDYVQKAAALIQARLDPHLRVHIEYSNEVWNGVFQVANYARDKGLSAGLSTNAFQAQMRWYSQRSQEIHTIFADAFVDEPERLLRIVAGQSTNPWVGTTVMDWDGTAGEVDDTNVADRFDHYAAAPYFGNSLGLEPQASITATWTMEQLLTACEAESLAATGPGSSTESNANNATTRGITLISYEGGQHLAGVGPAVNNDDLTTLFTAANRNEGMRQLYLDHMRRWSAAGGGLFVAYNHVGIYSKFGSWGLLENQNQDPETAPKLQGLLDWVGELTAAE